MRVALDGWTPLPRMCLVNRFELADGRVFTLDRPLFLNAGDRLSGDRGRRVLVVERTDGQVEEHPGEWCR